MKKSDCSTNNELNLKLKGLRWQLNGHKSISKIRWLNKSEIGCKEKRMSLPVVKKSTSLLRWMPKSKWKTKFSAELRKRLKSMSN